jgi:hypothetical protein
MPSLYNRVAGQSVERIAALSDGIFAVAMSLLNYAIAPRFRWGLFSRKSSQES